MSSAPAEFGPYVVTDDLGRGAMGVVYAARHRELGGAAAIKTVLNADPVKLSQIRREIHALARLRHPGVVQILSQGVEGGHPWYAMELLEGETLRGVFRSYWRDYVSGSGPGSAADTEATSATMETLPTIAEGRGEPSSPKAISDFPRPQSPLAAGGRLTEALSLTQRLCDILAYVHGEGVVHRDIKPANIFVRANGLPVLVDFGLTTEVGGPTGREVIRSLDRIGGSIPYMAPEQIRGEPLDARSDLYALGCLLYEMVTGRPPHIGTFDEIVQAQLQGELPPASSLAEEVPEELESLLGSLLEADRDRRLGYAEDVANRLAELGAMPPAWGEELPESRSYLYRPAFVGRGDILCALDAKLALPVDGKGALVFVSAESGAGKTRLALEVSARARRSGIRVIGAECIPVSTGTEQGVHSAPLHPLHSFIDTVADLCLAGGETVVKQLLGDRTAILATYFPRLTELPGQEGLPPPPPLPAEAARKRLFKALAETLAAFAKSAPAMLVLDDIQWADELTLGLLAHLGEGALQQLPLLVLCTFRSEEAHDRLVELMARARCDHLSLALMSRDEIGRMVGGMLALSDPPAGFVDFVADKSEGNPFFVAEYLRAAVSEQMLARSSSGLWRCVDTDAADTALESLPLPESLRQMVELRLERLSPETRTILEAAAVVGRVFEIDILRDVLGIDEAQMLNALDEMVRRQIIEDSEDGGFRFLHDKLREIPVDRLAEAERRSLHGRIAQAIEKRFGDSPAIEAWRGALGLHWSEAREPERAAPEMVAAADRAYGYNAVDEAIRLYEAALKEIAAARGRSTENALHWREQAIAVEEKLGDILTLTGRHAAARDAFDRAITQTSDAAVTVARLHRKCGKTWETQHEHEDALESYAFADENLETVREEDRGSTWSREWIQVALNRIWVHYWQVDVNAMNRELERVEPYIAEHGLPLHRYHYFMSIVLRDYRQYRYRVSKRTLGDAGRMLEAAQASGQAPEIAFAHFVLGFGLLFAGDLEDAETHLFEAVDRCRRISDVSGETRATAYLVLCYRRLGRVEQIREGARNLLRIATAQEMKDYVGVAQSALAWTAAKEGDKHSARIQAKQALDTWKALPFPYPFQWSAALTLLQLQMRRAGLGQLVDLAVLMREPEQMHLPDGIDEGLAKAIAAREAGDYDSVRRGLADAIAAATELAYL